MKLAHLLYVFVVGIAMVACKQEPVPRLPDPNRQYSGGSVTGNALELDVADSNIGKVPVFWHLPEDVPSPARVGYWMGERTNDSLAIGKIDSLLYKEANDGCINEVDHNRCR